MANSNTSLNGYEFGRSPKTQAPFWGGSGEGAEIDDTGIYTDKTWSSKKISDELAEKAEASELANYAKATAVYTKSQTYTKAEVDELLEGIPSVDAYTKSEVDTLLADKADKSDTYTKAQVNNLIPDVSGLATKTELNSGLATKANSDNVYSKSQTYTKTEVDNLIADIPAVDAYTKTQTDTLLADKANVSDLANYAKATAVYTKSQTYTKAEVDNLIAGAGGGAEIDDTTSAANKVWSSEKTRAALLKSAGLYLSNGVPQTWAALIRQKTSGSVTSTRNAMTEQFSADYQYSLSGGTVTVTIMYENDEAGQSYTINLTDIPWNDVASADYSTNYPSDNSRWKTIVASDDIFEICIGGNVSGSSGYYYPYIFVRVPKGTYASSISLSANLGNKKWAKAGSVAVINGYVTDSSQPIYTYDITSVVGADSAKTILNNLFHSLLPSAFARSMNEVNKINKVVVELSKTDLNGTVFRRRCIWNIKYIQTYMPHSSDDLSDMYVYVEYQQSENVKWIYSDVDLYKVTESFPSSTGNITGSMVSDTTTDMATVLLGFTDSWDSWVIKCYQ